MEASEMDLATPVAQVKGIGPKRSEALAAARIITVEDLLLYLPFRYEDRSRFLPISALTPGLRATVSGRIISSRLMRTRTRGLTLFEALVGDDRGSVQCLWFNQPYLRNVLKEGRRVVLFGETHVPDRGKAPVQFRNPQHEILGEDPERIHTGRTVPIYRRVGDLSTRKLRAIVHRLLGFLPLQLPEPFPEELIDRLGLPSRGVALREIHFPSPGGDLALLHRGLSPAHRRLAFEELFFLQLAFARARQDREARPGIPCPLSPEIRSTLTGILPFELTVSQTKVLGEIATDLAGRRPMSRLLQGDVGCGKTVVALLSALIVIENGGQVALMAPTEILAAQHFMTVRRFLAGTRYRVELLTAGVRGSPREEILGSLSAGGLDLVVGTHALIQDNLKFRNLGLAVVDEQHRFGVRQRALLGEKGNVPHFLMMTATPIPRSLALTLYGDLDVSIIDLLPPGRSPVRTIVCSPSDRPEIYAFIRREVEGGRRAAIVYPLVKESPRHELRSAVRESESLSRGPFEGLGVGLLHGQLPPQEKRRVMEAFATGRLPILVATTVLEVGIDVPEASILLVEHADRLGLSQLHQLRGRVGRGSGPSWCILMPGEQVTTQGQARLAILAETTDGFEIARRDLELRGPGELTGIRQSGGPELRVANLTRDLALLELAREEAGRSWAGGLASREGVRPRSISR